MRMNRLFLLLVATMLVVGLSVSAIYAQDTEDGVACDVDLMLDLYIAEKFFGFSSFTNQMTADDMGFDLNNFDRGQFAPLFDNNITANNADALDMSDELRNHIMETLAMSDAEFDTHFNDEMLPEIGEMMDEDFSTLTILPAADGMADEANECTALRRTLRRFFTGLVYGEVEFGNITTHTMGATDTTTEPADTTTESTDTDTTTNTGTVAGAINTNLSGAEEVPAPGDEDASGTAVVYLRSDNNEVCVDINVQNIALPATAAHIHQAPRGEAGPPVVPLNAPGENGLSSTCVEVDPALMQEMMNNTSNFYVNIHNAEFPDGAARGQLVASSSGTSNTTATDNTSTNTDTTVSEGALTVNLSGAEEVPGPGDEDASGTAVVYLRTDNNEVCVDITVQNIAPATAAHIHQAVDGQAGPPVVPLNTPNANGLSSTCAVIDAALMQEMVNNPTNFYVNVHNEEFPDGAARGQLVASSSGASNMTGTSNTSMNTDTTVSEGALTVNLSGAEEVPGPGDEDASGTAIVYLRTNDNEVCVDITVQNIAPATAAHIHQAVDGQSGPPVVPLNTPGENGVSSTCAVIDAALMQEMVNNPANFYVNVHNAEFPDGAARGQLGG